MNPSEYQKAAERTECDQKASSIRLSYLDAVRLNHAVVGITGEAGELASRLLDWIYYGKGLDRIRVGEELGDLLWFVAEACNALNLDMGCIMDANIAKLKARYPDRYTDELHDRSNRDDNAEQEALAKGFDALHNATMPRPIDATSAGDSTRKSSE